ncbi:MAG: hypothetical protein WDZ72_09355 [Cyclobacteriaceae bacterium]
MKKVAYFLALIMLFTSVAPMAMAKAEKKDKEKPELSPEDEAKIEELDARILEIKAMDFTQMDREERKEVRKELRDINKEAKASGGGVYLSVGAIIIILLVLILVL